MRKSKVGESHIVAILRETSIESLHGASRPDRCQPRKPVQRQFRSSADRSRRGDGGGVRPGLRVVDVGRHLYQPHAASVRPPTPCTDSRAFRRPSRMG